MGSVLKLNLNGKSIGGITMLLKSKLGKLKSKSPSLISGPLPNPTFVLILKLGFSLLWFPLYYLNQYQN